MPSPRRSHAGTSVERAADIVSIAACAFFALTAAWEIAGPLAGGHWAAASGSAICGENMLRHHILGAVASYVLGKPSPAQYYSHHPYGVFYLAALVHAVFGHHPWSVRLPAVLCSAFTAPLLYGLSRALWGAVPAAVATLTLVFVPVDLAYANFTNLEVPTIFFAMLFSWATVRLWQTWKTEYVALSALGAFGACQADWVGLIIVGCIGACGFAHVYVLPHKRLTPLAERQHARWFAYATAAAVGTLVWYLAFFAKNQHLPDLFGSYYTRSTGREEAWEDVFGQRRKMWFSWMVTPIGLGIVIASIPISIGRLALGPQEFIPLAWIFAATFQYLIFKQGADVHIFWPQYFGPSAALGFGAICATLLAGKKRMQSSLPAPAARWFGLATGAGLAVGLAVPIFLMARMALAQAYQARITSGRFDDGGRFIETEADASQFVSWVMGGSPPGAVLALTRSFPSGSHIEYSGGHVLEPLGNDPGHAPPYPPDRIAVLDVRKTSVSDLRAVAHGYSVLAAGPFWRIDRASGAGFAALRYVQRQPNLLERYFVTGSDLVRSIGPEEDPWATWEWKDALDLDPASPSWAPSTFEELRIAHNVAVAHGDLDRAGQLRERVIVAMEDKTRIDFTGDVRRLGMTVERGGAVPVATILWEAGPTYAPVDEHFAVQCTILGPPRLWFSKTDYFEKEVAPEMVLRPELWKPGYLYAQRFIVMHRIGVEACVGAFSPGPVRPVQGPETFGLFVLR